jgi:outer membrane PBP1 activator LpoA protein
MTLISQDNLPLKALIPLLAMALLLAGCTNSRPQTEYVEYAEKAVRKAEHDGAADYAPLELRVAREKLNEVRAAVEAGDGRRAGDLAEQCSVDAELASEKARTAAVRERAARLRDSIKVLNEEIASDAELNDA